MRAKALGVQLVDAPPGGGVRVQTSSLDLRCCVSGARLERPQAPCSGQGSVGVVLKAALAVAPDRLDRHGIKQSQ